MTITEHDADLHAHRISSRRRKLLRQLRRLGPEHFDQGNWFSEIGGSLESYNMDNDTVGIARTTIGKIDIVDCGSTACLAGHGAIIMAKDDAVDDEYISDESVAEYFEIDKGWFDSLIGPDHPGSDVHYLLTEAGLFEEADWVAQVYALKQLIEAGETY